MKQKLNITTFLLFWCITALWSIPRPEYPRPQFERMDWVNSINRTVLTKRSQCLSARKVSYPA